MNSNTSSVLQRKVLYEDFSRQVMRSDYFVELIKNNKAYRHVMRFVGNWVMLVVFMGAEYYFFKLSPILGVVVYPFYLYFQSLVISGFMVHSHELTHNHVRIRWLNNLIGVISGLVIFLNFYSFQYAHRFHHKNIGNLDTPEGGAPVSLTGQKQIRNHDFQQKLLKLLHVSKLMAFFVGWPIYIFCGDYSSWLLPIRIKEKLHLGSLACFLAIVLVNWALIAAFGLSYVFLYLFPVLYAGIKILMLTSMHHAHEDSVFFNEKNHNIHNVIMSTTDRDYGRIVNFFMMNNGFHIAHHMSPRIAYYDLPKASHYLRKTIPEGLKYNFYRNPNFLQSFVDGIYNQRLDRDYEFYQLKFLKL